jgi:UDP-N-acetylmuramate: L-alanyl-gamma-D-glutamyl-meso-diaminopimelate ligase
VKSAFRKFVELIPADGLLIVAGDSPGAIEVAKSAHCRVERYVVTEGRDPTSPAQWMGRAIAQRAGGRTLFEVTHGGRNFGTFDTGLVGRYNLANAVAVIAAMSGLGLSAEEIGHGVRRFAGVKRRQEIRGVAQGVTVIDDFAHHPTAVRETLAALRGRHGNGRVIAIFEPRSATSRRAVFQNDYADAFAGADEIIIGQVNHPEKAPAGDRFDPERLAADLRGRGVAARHLVEVDKIVDQVAESAAAGDTVVVMSSGSFGGLHDKLLSKLGDAVVAARHEDLPGVRALLETVHLGYPDLDRHEGELLLVRDPERHAVACVSLELYDDAGKKLRKAEVPRVVKTDAEWMKQLSPIAFRVARQKGTEVAYTGPNWNQHDKGLYRCICCDNALFSADTKYDSGTGWPSFYKPVDAGMVAEQDDRSWFMRRTEVHCANCDAHLGHVFPDGPKPTGLRYCINGVSLKFIPA